MNNESVKKCVLSVIGKNRTLTVLLAASAVFRVLLSLAPPQIMRVIIDRYLAKKETSGLFFPAALYLLVIVLTGAVDFFKGWLLTFFGQRTMREIRYGMMKKSGALPSTFFAENSPASVSSRIMTDVSNVDVLFSDGLVSMAVDSLKLIGIIISIWIFSFRLAIVALCLIPIVFAITRFFRIRMFSAQKKNLEQLGRVNGHIAESVKNILMVKLFSKERYMEEKYCRELSENYRTNSKVIFYDSCYAPVIQIIRAVVISIVVILSAEQIGMMGISVGMTAATIELISSLLAPVEALGMEIQNIQKGLSGIKRIDEFFALPEDEKDENFTAEKVISACGTQAAVYFKNLSFSYDGKVFVLKNMDAEISAGESVVIAGRTGVGKSTLFGLVMGLLKPTEGEVLIGGFDASKIPDREKRRIFGYVEQDFRFVPGTVADQISLGDPSITPEKISEICSMVGLAESIESLPLGYDTVVSSGSSFSWGQCQLLSIARAVAADPKILLLDEIAANLDSSTEERIMSVLKSVSSGRTVLSISHRESAMLGCDKLIYVEDGKIVAQGNPEEILSEIKSQ
ncbi:MAG: ABC transporter ATP-binding protein [Clostridiales bacterium]|nr:ABC transporter ATP-binding protein [Clostridiales bacterium]